MSFPGSENKRGPLVTVVSVTKTPTSETSHEFRAGTKGFTLTCNELEMLRVSWATSEVDDAATGNFFELYPRDVYSEDGCLFSKLKIYMNAPSAAADVDVAIVEWQ